MRSKYSIPKLSKKAVFILKEVHQDRNKMISYKISGGIASLMTGEKNLIPDSSKRTPESWEMALEELISTKLIVNIEIPDVYKITAKGYQLVDMLNNHVNDHTQNVKYPFYIPMISRQTQVF